MQSLRIFKAFHRHSLSNFAKTTEEIAQKGTRELGLKQQHSAHLQGCLCQGRPLNIVPLSNKRRLVATSHIRFQKKFAPRRGKPKVPRFLQWKESGGWFHLSDQTLHTHEVNHIYATPHGFPHATNFAVGFSLAGFRLLNNGFVLVFWLLTL